MALMVTKEPHCLDAILAAVKSGKLKAEIGLSSAITATRRPGREGRAAVPPRVMGQPGEGGGKVAEDSEKAEVDLPCWRAS